MERTLLVASGFALLAGIGLGVYAAVRHYRGRRAPALVTRLAVGLFAAGNGTALIYAIETPLTFVPLIGIAAFGAYWLARSGNRIAAGILLAALGLPGALWWGSFLVEDLLDPLDLYEQVLWLWWAPEAALIVIGALVALGGDRSKPVPALLTRTPTHVRDPIAVANALNRELAVGSIQIQTLVAVGVASPLLVLALPFVIEAGVPWPIALVGGTVAYAFVATEVWQLAMPRRVRSAWEGFTLISNPETKRWQETVRAPIPRTHQAMRHWLKSPDRPETRWVRAQLLIAVGDLDEARAVALAMPINSDWDRFEQQALLELITWVSGGESDLDALGRQAETVGDPDSSERTMARREVALARARDLAVSGGDWMAPLKAVRDEAGPKLAGRVFRDESRRHLYPQLLIVGAIFSVLLVLVSLVSG
jgi:hypothetical protein